MTTFTCTVLLNFEEQDYTSAQAAILNALQGAIPTAAIKKLDLAAWDTVPVVRPAQ